MMGSGLAAVGAALAGAVVEVGGRAFGVRPPTVREALVVMAAAEEGDRALLAEAVAGWLPRPLARRLTSRLPLWRASAGERERVVAACLAAGCPPPSAPEGQAAAEGRAKLREMGWPRALGEYRATYHPADVLGEPYPFFLVQLREVGAVRAMLGLDFVQAYSAARVPRGFDDLARRAGLDGAPSRAAGGDLPPCPEHLRGEAGQRWRDEKIREIQEKMGGANAAEA